MVRQIHLLCLSQTRKLTNRVGWNEKTKVAGRLTRGTMAFVGGGVASSCDGSTSGLDGPRVCMYEACIGCAGSSTRLTVYGVTHVARRFQLRTSFGCFLVRLLRLIPWPTSSTPLPDY